MHTKKYRAIKRVYIYQYAETREAIKMRKIEIGEKEEKFLSQLPSNISKIILDGFFEHNKRRMVVDYFKSNSFFADILMENPGTFLMLEKVYTGEKIPSIIDRFLQESKSAYALCNRLEAVIIRTAKEVETLLAQQNRVDIVNFGSGAGRDTVELLSRNPSFKESVFVTCIDIDSNAIEKGKKLAKEQGVSDNFCFVEGNILKHQTEKKFDIGLMIGVLCGLESSKSIEVLNRVRLYFQQNGILITSNVLETMLIDDPFMSYILKEVVGWSLVYKTPDALMKILEKADYKPQDVFFDEPLKYHAMAIGKI